MDRFDVLPVTSSQTTPVLFTLVDQSLAASLVRTNASEEQHTVLPESLLCQVSQVGPESLLCQVSQVGLYEGDTRLSQFDNGTIYITNQRLLWSSPTQLLSLSLSLVEKIATQNGFLKSSPKIILYLLHPSHIATSYTRGLQSMSKSSANETAALVEPWTCIVCEHWNTLHPWRCHECGSVDKEKQRIANEKQWTCSACTLLNPSQLESCAACGQSKHGLKNGQIAIIKLSCRQGGHSLLQSTLKSVLLAKEWEQKPITSKMSVAETTAGIAGLMRLNDSQNKEAEQTLTAAFTDLNTLMKEAGRLVQLANSLKQRETQLSHSQTHLVPVQEQESLVMCLSSMGLSLMPATEGTDEDRLLTQQLFQLLDSLTTRHTQLFPSDTPFPPLALIDLFCIWNRMRGTLLLSPQDVMRICRRGVGEKGGMNWKLVALDGGLWVLMQKEWFDGEKARERLVGVLTGGRTVVEVAHLHHLSVMVAKAWLNDAERQGWIVRDELMTGIRYYNNLFINIS